MRTNKSQQYLAPAPGRFGPVESYHSASSLTRQASAYERVCFVLFSPWAAPGAAACSALDLQPWPVLHNNAWHAAQLATSLQ